MPAFPKGLDSEVMEVLEACVQVGRRCLVCIVEDHEPCMFTSNLQSLHQRWTSAGSTMQ